MDNYRENNLWPLVKKPINLYESAHNIENCQEFIELAEQYFEPLKIKNFEFVEQDKLKSRLTGYYSELELLNNFRVKMEVSYVIGGGHSHNEMGLRLIDRLMYVRDGVLRDVEYLKNRLLNLEIREYAKQQRNWSVAAVGIATLIFFLRF